MSAKIDLEDFAKDLTKRLKRSVSLNDIKRLGNEALRLIKARVRRGFGVKNGRKTRLKRLAPSTILARKRKRLSPFTSPSKSNATESGRMIGGLRVTTRTGVVLIEPTGRSRSGIPNEDVAEFYSVDRPFLNLTRDEVDDLRDYYVEKILDLSKL